MIVLLLNLTKIKDYSINVNFASLLHANILRYIRLNPIKALIWVIEIHYKKSR